MKFVVRRALRAVAAVNRPSSVRRRAGRMLLSISLLGSVLAVVNEVVDDPTPASAVSSWSQVVAGGFHTCALSSAGKAFCWGEKNHQVGDGTATDRPAPVAIAESLTFSSIDGGFNHSCALTTAGAAYCWGQGDYGQLGDGSSLDQGVPIAVDGGHTFSSISTGSRHTCA